MLLRRMMRFAALLLIPLLVLSVIMILGGFADTLILYPTTGHEEVLRADRIEIPFEAGRLEIWVTRIRGTVDHSPNGTGNHSPNGTGSHPPNGAAGQPPRARPRDSVDRVPRTRTRGAADQAPSVSLLCFGGNADRAEWVVEAEAMLWAGHAVEIWSVNYPGYGGSSGPARLRALPGAALAAYDHLVKVAPERPVIVSGSSLGTTLALYLATERPVAGLALRNPPPLRNLILSRFGWWNLWLLAGPVAMQVPVQMDSLVNAPRSRVPAVFVLSERDEVVPARYQRKVVAAYAGPKRTIELRGASHNAVMDEAAMTELRAAHEWLWGQIF